MVISIDLKPILTTTQTYLSSAVSAAGTALTVINNGGFTADDYILLGNLASEQSELAAISTVATNVTINSSALKFPHSINTSVQKVLYNQIKVEKSTDNGSNWTVEATININGDQEYFDYAINGALTTDIYRTRFYNSTLSQYSPYSNEIAASGSVVETIINSIFSKLKIDETGDEQIKPEDLFNLIAEADLEISREIIRLNPNYFRADEDIDIVNGTTEYILPIDFVRSSRVLIKYSDDDTQFESDQVSENFGDTLTDDSLARVHYIVNKKSVGRYYLGLKKLPTEGVTDGITVSYIKQPIRIYQTSDDLNLPQSGLFIDVLENRVLHKIFMYYKDNLGLANMHVEMYQTGLQSIRQIVGMSDWSNEAYSLSAEVEQIFNPYGSY